jgi:hypothetical protein
MEFGPVTTLGCCQSSSTAPAVSGKPDAPPTVLFVVVVPGFGVLHTLDQKSLRPGEVVD